MNTQFKIEKNVPISHVQFINFPFDKMEIGDSFFIPAGTCKRQTISNHLFKFNRENKKDYKIACKSENDGFRVWRVK